MLAQSYKITRFGVSVSHSDDMLIFHTLPKHRIRELNVVMVSVLGMT